jgi:5-methylcytosine-specific restriction enzyme A
MAVFRWKHLPPVRRDGAGYYLCRLCRQPCPQGERSWCSERCLREYLTISSGNYVRAKLLERDRGICALCGVDCLRMDEALKSLRDDLLHPLLMSIHPMIAATLRAEGWTNTRLRGKGCYSDALEFSSCWEADHIVPVASGGGQCGISYFRTLCYVCHKKVSANQAAARAKRSRSLP